MFSLKKKKFYALTGDQTGSLLAEIHKGPHGRASATVLAQTTGLPVVDETNLHRLLSTVSLPLQGTISVVLPSHFFEIHSISLPVMPREAIGQALPYHLGKILAKPLNKYVYDWQITMRIAEKMMINVYLYPLAAFDMLRLELQRKKLELTHLENDVFAACAYLETENRLPPADATLYVLLWPESISFAIHENRVLTLVRTVNLNRPTIPYRKNAEPTMADRTDGIEFDSSSLDRKSPNNAEPETNDAEVPNISHSDSILMDFDILHRENGAGSSPATPTASNSDSNLPGNPAPSREWSDYLNSINLEIIRTRDYYTAVVKGAPLRQIFVGGCSDALQELHDDVRNTTGISLEPLEEKIAPILETPALYLALCLGTGARW